MPHPLVVQLRFTRSEFQRAVAGLGDADARQRFLPMNSVSWTIGHLASAEQAIWLTSLQGLTPFPVLRDQFRPRQPADTPPLAEMLESWQSVVELADPFLDTLTTEQLQETGMTDTGGQPPFRSTGSLLPRYSVGCEHCLTDGSLLAGLRWPRSPSLEQVRCILPIMKTWLNPKIAVRPSPIEGQGLFAEEPIVKGEQLTRNGEDDYVIMTDEELQDFIKTASSYDAVALGHGLHRVSTLARDEDPANYGNHCCDPNAGTNAEGLVALRDIQVDEEITCDYAPLSSQSWSMPCNCGAPNCRQIVRGLV